MPTPSWIGQTIGGRYKIESLLGQGGMSAVYKGTDPNLRRTIAIKLIHPHLAADPEFVRRFEEEAAAVAQLRHPNIIQVYDFNHDSDIYFMVLEFVPGQTLQERLKSIHAAGRRLPLDEVVHIMTTVCEAVHYAHERSMIHRDLKPANVMINASGQPILMDFGVAKIIGGQQHTATGAIVGTPTYISPEQVRGDRPDHRADIYSLGVMLFEMISGRVPFDSDTALSIMLKHLNDPVPDIRAINADVPEALAAAAQKALAKQPDDRFQSAHEMAAALRHAAASVPALPAEKTSLGAPSPVRPQPEPTATIATRTTPVPTPKPTSVDNRPATVHASPRTTAVEQPAKPAGRPNMMPILIGVGAVAVIGILVIAIIGAVVGGRILSSQPTPTAIAAATNPNTEVPVSVTEPVPTGSPAADSTDTAAPPTDTAPPPTAIPVPEGMRLIPAGFFKMGSDVGRADERPEHPVLLRAFYIDTVEVTNGAYRKCVEAGACTPSGSVRQNTAGFEDYPVMLVDWNQASTYCAWADKRLPTEAEWEYAAGGPDDLMWPWGNSFDASLSAASTPDLVPVGSFPGGASPFGALDMAGNANEWVADVYSQTFYADSPASNPFDATDGTTRVYRGGSYGNTDGTFYTTSRRYAKPPTFSDVDVGFRCAQDATEVNAATPQAEHDALVARFCEVYTAFKPGAACP